MNRRTLLATTVLAAAMMAPAGAHAAGEVNIYSYRQEVLIRPLLEAFTKETGIKVNLVTVRDGMLERLRAEGAASPADVVLTADAGNLIGMEKAGLLAPAKSAVLEANIPATYRDPQGRWFGVSVRARPIMFNPAKVKPDELSTYENLADPKWKGRICIRSSGHVYNLSLVAMLIAHNGAEKTQAWANGFAANLARKPAGGDRDQINALVAGICDIAISNTYYLAGMAISKDETERKTAEAVRVFWPNQSGYGSHVNISGVAMTQSAKNKPEAVKLMEFLSGEAAQRLYAESVQEYPVKPGIAMSATLRAFGEFKADALPLARIAEHQSEALRIVDRAGWR